MKSIVIHERDNVAVSLQDGHKYARCDIRRGDDVIKYGFPIGKATKDIQTGEHVHTHNLETALKGHRQYTYVPAAKQTKAQDAFDIQAFLRKNGDIGIRNDIWIIPTVGCINGTAQRLSALTGAFCFTHPYGCSQLGDDLQNTQRILCGLIKHPNAGGVLVLGLGCENNCIAALKEQLGEYDGSRVRFLNLQDCEDELTEGVRLIDALKENATRDVRVPVPVSKLKIGLKCGGSDGFSGITANPLAGKMTDAFTALGAACVLTEVPEMFGAEQLLMNRCANKETFEKAVGMIDGFKEYYLAHRQPISENPSPGNKEGGITTLEEKSLGCVQKGGNAAITDVLAYGEHVRKPGLSLLSGPGNDIVSVTNLAAAGCHLILFTTGRGTPLGAPVPTIKIASNTPLFEKKQRWIDFDAQNGSAEALMRMILDTVGGKMTKSEENGYREIAIFKNGVTL